MRPDGEPSLSDVRPGFLASMDLSTNHVHHFGQLRLPSRRFTPAGVAGHVISTTRP